MFTIIQHSIDAYSEMINTQIVLRGSCGLNWQLGHVCPGDSFAAPEPFCCVCGCYHGGAACHPYSEPTSNT